MRDRVVRSVSHKNLCKCRYCGNRLGKCPECPSNWYCETCNCCQAHIPDYKRSIPVPKQVWVVARMELDGMEYWSEDREWVRDIDRATVIEDRSSAVTMADGLDEDEVNKQVRHVESQQ